MVFDREHHLSARDYKIDKFKKYCVTLDELTEQIKTIEKRQDQARENDQHDAASIASVSSWKLPSLRLSSTRPISVIDSFVASGLRAASVGSHIGASINRWSVPETMSISDQYAIRNDTTTTKSFHDAYTALAYKGGDGVTRNEDVQIRLLSFVSADTFKFETFTLEDAPPYIPISYAWGSGDGQAYFTLQHETIENGRKCTKYFKFAVSETVHELLRSLYWHRYQMGQHKEEHGESFQYVKYYWIDAICIHQGDLDEKAHQIAVMSDIYKRGSRLYIYLGLDDDTAGMGLRAIQVMRDCVKRGLGTTPKWLKSVDVLAFHHFLRKPWFRRCWIIQEYAWSTHSYMLCGTRLFNAHDLQLASQCFSHLAFAAEYPSLSEAPDAMTNLFNTKHEVEYKNFPTLRTLIARHRGAKATMGKDKIYSLVSMASDFNLTTKLEEWKGNTLFVQQTLRLGNLVYQIIRQWNKVDGNLDFLQFISNSYRSSHMEYDHVTENVPGSICIHAPSWFPDFTLTTDIHTLQGHEHGYPAVPSEGPGGMAVRRPGRRASSDGRDPKNDISLVQFEACGHFNKFDLKPILTPYTEWAVGGDRVLHSLTLPVIGTILGQVHAMGHMESTARIPHLWFNDPTTEVAIEYLRDLRRLAEDIKLLCAGQKSSKYFNGDLMTDVLICCYTASHHRADSHEAVAALVEEFFKDFERNIEWAEGIAEHNVKDVIRLYQEHRTLSATGRDSIINDWWPVSPGRRIFRSNTTETLPGIDFICGLCPGTIGSITGAKVTDSIAIIAGCNVPMILRENTQKGGWEVIGECYVHGFMDGRWFCENQYRCQTLNLV